MYQNHKSTEVKAKSLNQLLNTDKKEEIAKKNSSDISKR